MKVLFVYRAIGFGYSIDNEFRPIEKEMRNYCDVDSYMFSKHSYKPNVLIHNIISFRKYVKTHPCDIIHITGTDTYLLPFLRNYRTVVTINDLYWYTKHKKSIKNEIKRWMWIRPIASAGSITYISEEVRRDSLTLLRMRNHHTYVIGIPVNPIFQPNKNYEFFAEKPVILQIGTKENKNMKRLIYALRGIQCHLRVIGRLSDADYEFLKRSDVSYSQAKDLSNEEIKREYDAADIVAFVSTAEGFGMPIIEGMASGKVVVTSNISPMRDIANGGCVLADPYDITSIHNAILYAIEHHKHYEQIGPQKSEAYRLSEITRAYYEVYQREMKDEGSKNGTI